MKPFFIGLIAHVFDRPRHSRDKKEKASNFHPQFSLKRFHVWVHKECGLVNILETNKNLGQLVGSIIKEGTSLT